MDVAEAQATVARHKHRLRRERTITIAGVLAAGAERGGEGDPGEVIAGLVVQRTDPIEPSFSALGLSRLVILDGTGVCEALVQHGTEYEAVRSPDGEHLNARFEEWFSPSVGQEEDDEGYVWEAGSVHPQPTAQPGDLIAMRVQSIPSETGAGGGSGLLRQKCKGGALRRLTTTGDDDDADWHPRFPDPQSSGALSVSSLLAGPSGPVVAAALPSLLKASDGVSLIAEGTSVLVSGPPDAGKSWFALLAMHDLLHRKPWGRVVWFDADGLGEATIFERLLALGCPEDWLGTRFVVQPVGSQPLDRWTTFVAEVASEVMPIGVVWDGLNAALTATGCGMDEAGVVRFRHCFMDPFRHSRPACVVLDTDHVTKGSNARTDRYSYGAQGKLAQHDQHLRIIATSGSQLTRTTAGRMILVSQRDRRGTDDWTERTLTITPGTPFQWEHVSDSDLTGEERLEYDLQQVVGLLRENGPLNTSELRRALNVKSERVTAAVRHGVTLRVIGKERHGTANVYALADEDSGATDSGGVSA